MMEYTRLIPREPLVLHTPRPGAAVVRYEHHVDMQKAYDLIVAVLPVGYQIRIEVFPPVPAAGDPLRQSGFICADWRRETGMA